MRAYFEHIVPESKRSIVYKYIELPVFDSPYHYHPEYELTYIIKGEGLRYVGTSIEEFGAGEWVLLGPNVPHHWQSRTPSDGGMVKAFVIQFKEEVFQNAFVKLTEFDGIRGLLQQAVLGLHFHEVKKTQWKNFIDKSPLEQFLELVILLNSLNKSTFRTITNPLEQVDISNPKFQKVLSFLVENYKNEIGLEEVAQIGGFSKTAFCRFFKAHSGKTFMEFVLDYRLKAACQLLLRSNLAAKEIAYEVGFQDLPYFYRAFKKVMGMSPMKYRKFIKDKPTSNFKV